MKRVLYLLPVGLFIVLASYFFVALRPGHDPRELPSAMIDKEAPAFDLARLHGEGKLARDTLKGGPIVLNFFASWCVPCRTEQPVLMRLKDKEKIPLYGIAYKDEPSASNRFLAQLGDPYRAIGVDRDGRAGLDFGVYGVPETYVIDAQGHIRKRFVGPLTGEEVEKELLPLLRSLGWS
jgi:cytochrome c biogenesis protein CcmG, thiol:disulfide interchange protein DsbE